MSRAHNKRPLYQRIAIDIAGASLLIISPFAGLIPGPGGIPVFLAGLGLLATNHIWAQRLVERVATSWKDVHANSFLANPHLALPLDALFSIIIVSAIIFIIMNEHFLIRGLCFGLISLSLLLLFTKQNRFQRLQKALKARRFK